MTQGNPVKLIIVFAIPLMIGNVFQQLYTVVDTMVVGKALGVGALAALGATDWLNWLFSGIVQGFAQGFCILMAQEFGSGNYKQLRKVIYNSLLLCIICSVLILLTSEAVAQPVLHLLNTPEEIMPDSLLYLRIIFLGMPIIMAYNISASILRALGDGRTPLYAMIVASITNIVLDLLFVLVFHMGIAGAAIAKANPMRTGFNATKLAIAAFIVPYVFALNPAMLFIDTTPGAVILIVITSLIGMYGVASGLEGYMFRNASWWERLLSIAGGLLLIYPGIVTDAIGLALVGLVVVIQLLEKRHDKKMASV